MRKLRRVPTPLAHHVIVRHASNAVLARTPAERRVLARAVLAAGREAELFAFFAPDGHLHAAVGADRAAAGRFAQRVILALRAALPLEGRFDPAWIKPVEDQAHLRRLVPYVLGQAAHHGVDAIVGLDASNLPDLLGLRPLGAYTIPSLRARLPRLSGEELRGWLAVGELGARLDLAHLADAAAAAAALPDLRGRSEEAVDARAAAIAAARGGGVDGKPLAAALGLPVSTFWRLAARPVAPALVNAVLLQCDARRRLAERYAPDRPFGTEGAGGRVASSHNAGGDASPRAL